MMVFFFGGKMPRYQYDCPTHGEFEKFKHSSDDLTHEKCPECKAKSKRVWYATAHFFQGSTAPNIFRDTQKTRVRNNKKIYGEAKTFQMERDYEKSHGMAVG